MHTVLEQRPLGQGKRQVSSETELLQCTDLGKATKQSMKVPKCTLAFIISQMKDVWHTQSRTLPRAGYLAKQEKGLSKIGEKNDGVIETRNQTQSRNAGKSKAIYRKITKNMQQIKANIKRQVGGLIWSGLSPKPRLVSRKNISEYRVIHG